MRCTSLTFCCSTNCSLPRSSRKIRLYLRGDRIVFSEAGDFTWRELSEYIGNAGRKLGALNPTTATYLVAGGEQNLGRLGICSLLSWASLQSPFVPCNATFSALLLT